MQSKRRLLEHLLFFVDLFLFISTKSVFNMESFTNLFWWFAFNHVGNSFACNIYQIWNFQVISSFNQFEQGTYYNWKENNIKYGWVQSFWAMRPVLKITWLVNQIISIGLINGLGRISKVETTIKNTYFGQFSRNQRPIVEYYQCVCSYQFGFQLVRHLYGILPTSKSMARCLS